MTKIMVMGTQKQKFAEMVKVLEQPETFFGLVIAISSAEHTTYREAWEKVENERRELGLPPKFCSYGSYRVSRYKFEQSGGMIRIMDFPSDDCEPG